MIFGTLGGNRLSLSGWLRPAVVVCALLAVKSQLQSFQQHHNTGFGDDGDAALPQPAPGRFCVPNTRHGREFRPGSDDAQVENGANRGRQRRHV
jgi:hypothetical protein